ncbi:MAG: NHLP family bacteriocin export ABC transporter peptidase/permease/ATPase subunit [Chlamydiales bacterium]|nr:NHLP family bacteriocin export ABC transporter peptidase/permease/ATPase subunit [Chlamydiales bacterium]
MMQIFDRWKKRHRTPTVIQMEAVECAAASLAIVLGYYGKFIPLEELRIECGVSRDGSNAFNLIQAAEKYGMESAGFKAEMEDLQEMQLPFVVFWNFNHFLVVEGFSKKFIYINDPASGPRKISYEEFDKAFTGVVITMQPGEDFKKVGKAPALWPMLKARLWGVMTPISFISLAGIFLVLPGLAVPAITQIFYDQVLGAHHLGWKNGITFGLLGLVIVVGAITWLQCTNLNRLYSKLSIRFSGEFFWHILRLPVSFYAQRFSGEIAHRITLNEAVTSALTGNLATTFINIVLIIFYAFVMFQYNVTIALIGILAAFLNLLILWLINRSRNDAYARVQQETGKSIGFAIGALQNIESIKAAGNEADLFTKWAGYYTKTVNAQREINLKDVILTSFPALLQGISTAALLGIGGWKVLHGELTIGMLLALQGLLGAFLSPVAQMVNLGSTLQTIKIDIARLDDVLKNAEDPVLQLSEKGKRDDHSITRLEGYLEFKNVTFGYSPLDPPLIENLNITLKPGQRIALVGPSGCGKSTIAKLVSGLYQPWSGEIFYDGKLRPDIPAYVFHNSLSAVDQKIFLFSGLIRENLTLWDATVEDKEIIQAAKDACIHEEIILRQHGYDTLLEEEGANFSGGERQRLEIARALVCSPRVLIMDEATSALDSKTEEIISRNIRQRGCTCVMIAHRLSTIQECDEILVLDKGRVVQRGTHFELKSTPGLYQDLVNRESVLKEMS